MSGTPANQERKGGEERDQQLRAERGCLRKEGSGVLNHLINSNCRRSVPLCCRCMPAVPKCAKRAKCRCRLRLPNAAVAHAPQRSQRPAPAALGPGRSERERGSANTAV